MAFLFGVPVLSPGLQAVDFTVPDGGSVTGSSSHDQYPPAKAFDDGGDAMEARWLPLQADLPNVFIQYDFGRPVLVSTYMIQGQHFDFEVRSPKDWKLQGSQNATDWVDLDTVAGETTWGAWEKRSFTVAQPGAYRYYKLVFSAANGANQYMGFGEIELGIDASEAPPASWSVSHLTGDADSGVDSNLTYTAAVSVNGTADKVVNGVTFKASNGTTGDGWEITENFHKLHGGETSTVGGVMGEVLTDGFRYDGNPQKLKLTGLTPGYMYTFSFYNQAWGVGGERNALLSLDDVPGVVTYNQQEFSESAQDGQLVQCRYLALDSDIEFSLVAETTNTWHLYGFSNAELETGLLPSIRFDSSNATEPLVTLHWEADVTEFTLDDITLTNATANNFQAVDARKHTFTLVPDANKVDISITIGAATLKVGGADNEAFATTYPHSFSTLPSIQIDGTDPNAQLVTLDWLGNVTGFAADDITVTGATLSGFLEVDPRKHTFTLAPDSNNVSISITIGATTLKVSGGDNEEFTHSFDHYHHDFSPKDTPLTFFTEELGASPLVWFDAGDAATVTGTSPVTMWEDKSGNGRHAVNPKGNPVYNPTGGRWDSPVVEIRKAGGDDYLDVGGEPFFAKEHYYVFRSADAADRWDYFGAVLAHRYGRNSNYLFENNNRNFHGNQRPDRVQQNGYASQDGGTQLKDVNQFMILRIVVNDNDTSPKDSYQIGRSDNAFTASIDIAEVLAFDKELNSGARQKLEGYLARKWGLVDRIDANHPYRSEPPVITLAGEASVRVPLGGAFTDPGATATDPEDGPLDNITVFYQGPLSDPPPLAADTYPGLQLWLKADEGFTPGGWTDQSSNALDATAHGNPPPELVDDAQNGLPVMRYSGADGTYHSFSNFTDIRTVFWVVKRNSGPAFLLGDNDKFHFHSSGGVIFNGGNSHDSIDNGRFSINGQLTTPLSSDVPAELSVLSLRTTGNVEASNFSNDRSIAGRYWNGDLAELLIFNTALTDIQIADIEARLGHKWGLPYTPVSVPVDNLDTSVLGDWIQTYTAADSTGHASTAKRTIRVFNPDAPVITLTGDPDIHHEQGAPFIDPGYTVADASGGTLDASGVTVTGTVDANLPGMYELAYDFEDAQGRAAETVFRTVEVSDTLPPLITLTGGDSIKHPLGQPYVDPGFSAYDLAEGYTFIRTSLYVSGIRHQGFTIGQIETLLNFNENGGLLEEEPAGENILQGAINFTEDSHFMDAGVGLEGRPDNYNNLFTGLFAAKKTGTYQFQISGRDDRGSFWLDLNRNGVFESNGSAGSEWMNGGYTEGLTTVRLDPGFYRFAVGHNEGSGGSRIIAQFSAPEGAGPTTLTIIDSTQPNQDGAWVIENPINTGELGTHTITYATVDSLGHAATATRTVEVIDVTALPVVTLSGRAILTHEQYTDFIEPGYSVADADGNPLDATGVEVSGFFDTDAPGVYELLYTFYDANGLPADPKKRVVEVVDTVPPTVNIIGDAEIEHVQGTPFTDPGATHEADPDGELFIVSTAQFPTQSLWLHADASNIHGLQPGEQVLRWTDISGNGNDISNVRGDPQLVADGINGRPVVRVDGNDFLATAKDASNKYSIFTVSRWGGTVKGRLFSSNNRNWFIGYWRDNEDTFHPGGWASGYITKVTTDPHIYTATSTGNTHVQFLGDRQNLTTDTRRNEHMGKFQIGGHGATGGEPASGDVAEVLIYNNYVVSDEERMNIEGMLAIKYGLFGYPKHDLPDLTQVGEHTIHYAVQDATGNVGTATRKVTVLPDPEIPIITLVGDQVLTHEATTAFTDPGVTIKDGNGQDLDAGPLVVGGSVDVATQGLQVLTYNYTTAGGKVAKEVLRNVIVRDTTGPALTLLGDAEVRIQVGDTYTDAGLTANDTLDGDLDIYKETDIPASGLLLHLDAGTLAQTYASGDIVTSWPDISGQGNDADNTYGDPTFLAAGPNGRPVVNFDGNDMIWTTKNFQADLDNYTMISIARYTGGANNRVIAARSANIAFGFHGNRNQQWLLNSWVSNHGGVDTFWHLHVGDVNNQDRANFWVDGVQRATNSTGGDINNYKPDQIQLGGWRTQNEMSKAEVAELLLYNRVISEEERNLISAALNAKYGKKKGGFGYVAIDTTEPGTHNIRYRVVDATGNVSEAVRTVIVSADPSLPFIVMDGEAEVTLEAGSVATYSDPGAVAKADDVTPLKDDLVGVGEVDVMNPGTYTLAYDYTDTSNNVAETAIRTIRVVDTLGPEITLAGDEPMKLFVDQPFQDPGATSNDLRDGEVPVYSHYLSIPDTLRFEYHMQGNNIAHLYLDNNGGVLDQSPYRTSYFTDGFHGDGINFQSKEDFKSYTEILRNDTYQIIFSGYLDARRDGAYGFSASKLEGNDYCTIWVDRDQDGLLERSGDLGDEQVVWDNQVNTVHLDKGEYWVVIGYSQWNSLSAFNAKFHTPDGAGPSTFTTIHPGGPGQEGLWRTKPRTIDTSVTGEHTITYFADDLRGNRSTLARQVIVEEDTMKPVILLLGNKGIEHHAGFPYNDSGVLLEDFQGNPLDESLVQVSGVPTGFELGEFTIRYNYTDGAGHIAGTVTRRVIVQDIVAPAITVHGANPATVQLGQPYMDAGATAVDAFDGPVTLYHTLGFNREGLALHLDAASFAGVLNDGDTIAIPWQDLSGNGNHADNQVGNPTWKASTLNGKPVVDFDGDDVIYTTKDFEPDLANYTVFLVARYTTNNTTNRVISTSGPSGWLLGYHGNTIRRFHSGGGWVYNVGGMDANWHIHAANASNQDQANFWLDGAHLAKNSNALHNTNYKPHDIVLGGWNPTRERSKCQVAELIIFNRVVSPQEHDFIQMYLQGKYNLLGGSLLSEIPPVDTSVAGQYTVEYASVDSNGNISKATRTVNVVNEPDLPVITLTGNAEVSHPTGQPYVDAGATVAAAQGAPFDPADFVVSDGVNTDLPGEYVYSYDFTDGNGNAAATAVRKVIVTDQTPPAITLLGEETIIHQLGNRFTDPGYSASDLVDGVVQVESSMLKANRFRLRGYMQNWDSTIANLDGNGGLLLSNPLRERTDLGGSSYFNGDGAFLNAIPEITRTDVFQILLDGHFYTASGGKYEFGIDQSDQNDRTGFWLDLDGDGVFEADGDKGSELMNPGYMFGYREVDLSPGYYRYAVAFAEYNGGSKLDARYRAIVGEGPGLRTQLNAADPLQKGQWNIYNPIDVLAPGDHTITYTAVDGAGNVGTAIRTVTVRNNPDAGVISLIGEEVMTTGFGSTFTDPEATIADIDGQELPKDNLVITGTVDTGKLGEYILEYNYTTDAGVPSRTKTRTVIVADLEPPVITLNGDAEITITQGTVYVDQGATAMDNLDGEFVVMGTSEYFPEEGLFTHLDASYIRGKATGDAVTFWYDRSAAGNNAADVTGTPTFVANSINGRPAVRFDGSSFLALGKAMDQTYSVLTISKPTDASPQRLMSSKDRNWLFGYHSGHQHRFHVPNGWVTTDNILATGDAHLHSATSGERRIKFYANGKDLTDVGSRRDDNYSMGVFQMGGWMEDGQQASSGDVAEVIIYDRVLTSPERLGIEARLNSKYGLNGVDSVVAPVDTSTLGEYHVVYQAVDSAGNIATKMRKVTVAKDPNAPSLALVGDAYMVHEAGETFTDPGATLLDAQGAPMAGTVEVTNDLDPNVPGIYTFTYSFNPDTGSPAPPVSRTVEVEDTQGPVITLNGDEVVKLAVGATYVEAGATATDLADGSRIVLSQHEYTLDQLAILGYMVSNNDSRLDLEGADGLLNQSPVGESVFINGPGNRGMQYYSDGEIRTPLPGVTSASNYQTLYSGIFIPPVAGTYSFDLARQDDRVSIWLDLDQDGQFEAAGEKGDEQLRDAGQSGVVNVDLEYGIYKFAVAYRQGGGGAAFHVRYTLPGQDPANIRPGIQPNQWASMHSVPFDTSVAGTFTIGYVSSDKAGNLSRSVRTVVVVEDSTLPFIALNGGLEVEHELGTAFTDPLAKVTDDTGQVLKDDLAGVGTVDANTLGEYTLTYDYTHTDGSVAEQVVRKVIVVDTVPPAVSLKPHPATGGTDTVELTVGDTWEDPGIDITDKDASSWFVSSRDYIPNRLFHAGFQDNVRHPNVTNFENGGGFLSMTPNGSTTLTTGPGGRGFNYVSDAEFRQSPIGITLGDWYGSYISGYFHARESGEYTFQSEGHSSDYMAIWLDFDQDGIFGISEQIAAGASTQSALINLDLGHYRFAAAHYGANNQSIGRLWVQTPQGAGPSALEIIKPAALSQAGLWNLEGAGPIDTAFPGTHTITYYAFDTTGHLTRAIRTVVVKEDPDAPVLTLVGDAIIQHQIGTDYTETRPTIAKADGTPIDDQANIVPTITGAGAAVDKDTPGTYDIQYDYTDGNGKKAIPVFQTVIVGDFLAPDITLLGDNPYHLTPGYAYIEPGATSTDTIDGDLEVTLPTLDFSTASETTLQLEYSVTDAAGNTATTYRELIIQDDPNRSIIVLTDGKSITHEAGSPFVDPGFTFTNGRGHDLDESEVTVSGTVDHTALGTYTVEYSATGASTIRREVTVVDTTTPVIVLTGGEYLRWDIGKEFIDPGATVTDNLDAGLVPEIKFQAEGLQPILYWDFNQATGTVLPELMNGADGALKSFPDPDSAWVAGKYGNALIFDAATGNHIEIPGTELLDLQEFTISVWIQSSDYNVDMFVFEKTTNNLVNSQFNLHFESDEQFYFRTVDDAGTLHDVKINSTDWLVPDEWQHIAVSYDGVQKKIYMDKQLAGVGEHDVTLPTNPTGKSYIGANAPGDGAYFNGMMDDLKVYNQVIPEDQINTISNRSGVDTSKERLDPPYKFLYTATDSSGNTSTIERWVVVSNDSTPPSLQLQGDAETRLKVGDTFVDQMAIAIDNGENVSSQVKVTGTVDTTKAGVYVLSYDIMDASYNAAPTVTRTVIVEEDTSATNPLEDWINTHLSGFTTEQKNPEADPDQDGLQNLLEYALGSDPSHPNSSASLPNVDASSGHLTITFFRLKSTVDNQITYTPQLATSLSNPVWDSSVLTVALATQQEGLPSEDYERVTATANVKMSDDASGQQFIRILVQRPN